MKKLRRCLWIVLLLVLLVINGVLAADGEGSEGASDEFRSIYSKGDLILANPQQSTSIFICIIVFSTGIEFLIEVMEGHENIYIRTIFLSVKDEVTVIGATELLMLFAAFSFPLHPRWRFVMRWVVMCLLYMAISYALTVTGIMAQLRVNGNKWRSFEMARIDADVHHNNSEQLFKLAKRYFARLLAQHGITSGTRTLPSGDTVSLPLPKSVFSTYMGIVERRELNKPMDFSIRTYFGLGLLIIINGSRASTVLSADADGTMSQVISFILIIGFGIFVSYIIAHLMLERRLRSFLIAKTIEGAGAQLSLDLIGSSCFFFGSLEATYEVFRVAMLSMMWYVSVLIMAFAYLIVRETGWLSIVLFLIALVPTLLLVWRITWTLNIITMINSLGLHFKGSVASKMIDQLRTGVGMVVEDTFDKDKEEEEKEQGEENYQRQGISREERRQRADDFREMEEETEEHPDEWQNCDLTFHDDVDASAVPLADPAKLIGVAPAKRYVVKPPHQVI